MAEHARWAQRDALKAPDAFQGSIVFVLAGLCHIRFRKCCAENTQIVYTSIEDVFVSYQGHTHTDTFGIMEHTSYSKNSQSGTHSADLYRHSSLQHQILIRHLCALHLY